MQCVFRYPQFFLHSGLVHLVAMISSSQHHSVRQFQSLSIMSTAAIWFTWDSQFLFPGATAQFEFDCCFYKALIWKWNELELPLISDSATSFARDVTDVQRRCCESIGCKLRRHSFKSLTFCNRYFFRPNRGSRFAVVRFQLRYGSFPASMWFVHSLDAVRISWPSCVMGMRGLGLPIAHWNNFDQCC